MAARSDKTRAMSSSGSASANASRSIRAGRPPWSKICRKWRSPWVGAVGVSASDLAPRRRRSPGPPAPDEDRPAEELPLSSSAAYRRLLSTGGDAAAWVRPRRGAGPQGPCGPARHRSCIFLPEEHVVEGASGDLFLDQAPQIAQVGDGPPHAEAFASRLRLLPQLPGHLIGSFPIFLLAVGLRVESLSSSWPVVRFRTAPSAARSSSSRFYTGPARRPTPRSASRPLRTGRAPVARAWVVDPPSGWAGSEAGDRRGRPAPASLARG